MTDRHLHLTHWGAFEAGTDGERITAVEPFREDPEPYRLLENLPTAHQHATRIDRPYVRRGWLEHGPGPTSARGADRFVPVTWDAVLDRLATELRRAYREHGPDAVFGGSYGWASAGRFHHAQSQIHRFLNGLGGYVRSVTNYSYGASQVLLPHILTEATSVFNGATTWKVIAEHTDLIVAFGGMATKNAGVAPGGISRHDMGRWHARAHRRGARFVLVSPLRDDLTSLPQTDWIDPVPGTDTALMLGLAYTLVEQNLHDKHFLDRYTVGFAAFRAYLDGTSDGIPKTPRWAQSITGIDAGRIRRLARRMTRGRTLITVSWSMQRAHHGEQPVWMALVLAAMIGQIGLPGGGFGHGYASSGHVGQPRASVRLPVFPQGTNPVTSYIPVARIADMLLEPGGSIQFNGECLTYPDIRLVYWCGGNPFHHHQDLKRLATAFGRPDTVVVHDSFWTSTARHADIVLPATMSVERNDIGGGPNDRTMFAMHRLVRPHAASRSDYAIFSELAHLLGVGERFTEGRDEAGWLRHMYATWREDQISAAPSWAAPSFDDFWQAQTVDLPEGDTDQVFLADFRADPVTHPLPTDSGRIEITCSKISSFRYPDCPGHPTWLEPDEWLGSPLARRYPLHLIANQPRTRLHSQLDVGAYSQESKVDGREPIRMHPADADERGLRDGQLVTVVSVRGTCLAGLRISDELRPGVVQLSTGAWYDPDTEGNCRHGNPNVLTTDRPTSQLSQACAGQHALVDVRAVTHAAEAVTVLGPPDIDR